MIKRDSKFIITAIFLFIVINGMLVLMSRLEAGEFWHSWGTNPSDSAHIDLPSNLTHIKKDIVIAVIDTGIDPKQPILKDNMITIKGKITTKNYGKDFSPMNSTPNEPFDHHGHGTHIAGIIKSVFPEVKILALKYYNPNASGRENLISTLQALRFAIDSNVDIINYSGGGPEASAEELQLLQEAAKKNILVVAASGNEQQDLDHGGILYYPASYKLTNVITVTTHDQKGQMHPSSNWGVETVDLAAPGDRIKSTLPFNRTGFLTGTSQSTAFVSGVAGMIKARYPHLKAKELKDIIVKSAEKIPSLAGKCATAGKLNAASAWQLAQETVSRNTSRNVASSPGKIIYRLSSEPKPAEAQP